MSDVIEQQAIRLAGMAIAKGLGPQAIYKAMADRIVKIGKPRAQAVVSVAVVSAHAMASLNAYANAGHTKFNINAESVPSRRRGLRDAPRQTSQPRHGETGKFITHEAAAAPMYMVGIRPPWMRSNLAR